MFALKANRKTFFALKMIKGITVRDDKYLRAVYFVFSDLTKC